MVVFTTLAQIFGVFWELMDVAAGKNVLYIYIYSVICSNVALRIHVTVVRGLQRVSEAVAPLTHFKLKIHYQI